MNENIKKILSRLVLFIVLLIVLIASFVTVNTNFAKEATIKYTFGDGEVVEIDDKEDIEALKNILNGATRIGGGESCGFGGLEIVMKGSFRRLTFIPAADGCEILYIPSKNLYMDISDEDRDKIDEIFTKYGLPCKSI